MQYMSEFLFKPMCERIDEAITEQALRVAHRKEKDQRLERFAISASFGRGSGSTHLALKLADHYTNVKLIVPNGDWKHIMRNKVSPAGLRHEAFTIREYSLGGTRTPMDIAVIDGTAWCDPEYMTRLKSVDVMGFVML